MITAESSQETIVSEPTAHWMQEMHTRHANDQPYYHGDNLCLKFIRVGHSILSAPLVWTTAERRRFAPVTTHAEIAGAAGIDLERASDAGFMILQLLKNELSVYGSKTTLNGFDTTERNKTVELMEAIAGNDYSVTTP